MDWPVLRYLDVAIGLGVVMLIGATVVASATQLVSNAFSRRARLLKSGLTDFVAALLPELKGQASALVTDMLADPRIARPAKWWDRTKNWFWRLIGQDQRVRNHFPGEVLQREELILLLLERAMTDQAVASTLAKYGVPDAEAALKGIRQAALAQQAAKPESPSQLWITNAVIEAAPSDFVGKIFNWHDNMAARVKERFAIKAKFTASCFALVFAILCQLDSIGLMRRLLDDDRLRASLVKLAEEKVADGQPQSQSPNDRRAEIDTALAELRDPKLAAIPGHFAFEQVQQVSVPKSALAANVTITVDDNSAEPIDLALVVNPDQRVSRFIAEIRRQKLPVIAYRERNGITLVAARSDIAEIQVTGIGAAPLSSLAAPDLLGLRARLPGVLLSWIFLTLGAPFWYDLVKKALGFRSSISQKDDKERQFRVDDQRAIVTKH